MKYAFFLTIVMVFWAGCAGDSPTDGGSSSSTWVESDYPNGLSSRYYTEPTGGVWIIGFTGVESFQIHSRSWVVVSVYKRMSVYKIIGRNESDYKVLFVKDISAETVSIDGGGPTNFATSLFEAEDMNPNESNYTTYYNH